MAFPLFVPLMTLAVYLLAQFENIIVNPFALVVGREPPCLAVQVAELSVTIDSQFSPLSVSFPSGYANVCLGIFVDQGSVQELETVYIELDEDLGSATSTVHPSNALSVINNTEVRASGRAAGKTPKTPSSNLPLGTVPYTLVDLAAALEKHSEDTLPPRLALDNSAKFTRFRSSIFFIPWIFFDLQQSKYRFAADVQPQQRRVLSHLFAAILGICLVFLIVRHYLSLLIVRHTHVRLVRQLQRAQGSQQKAAQILAEVEQKLQASEERKTKLQDEKSCLQDKLSNVINELSSAQKDITLKQAQIDGLQNEVGKKQAQINRLRYDNATQQAQVARLQQEKIAHQAQISRLLADENHQQQEIRDLQDAVSGREMMITALEKDGNERQRQNECMVKRNRSQFLPLEDLRQSNAEQQEQVIKLQDNIAALTEDGAQKEVWIQELEKSLSAALDSKKSMKAQVKMYQVIVYISWRVALARKTVLESKEMLLRNALEGYTELHNYGCQMTEAYIGMKAMYDRVKSAFDDMAMDFRTTRDEYKKLDAEKEQIARDLHDARYQKMVVTAKSERRSGVIRDLNNIRGSLEQELSGSQIQIASLQAKLDKKPSPPDPDRGLKELNDQLLNRLAQFKPLESFLSAFSLSFNYFWDPAASTIYVAKDPRRSNRYLYDTPRKYNTGSQHERSSIRQTLSKTSQEKLGIDSNGVRLPSVKSRRRNSIAYGERRVITDRIPFNLRHGTSAWKAKQRSEQRASASAPKIIAAIEQHDTNTLISKLDTGLLRNDFNRTPREHWSIFFDASFALRCPRTGLKHTDIYSLDNLSRALIHTPTLQRRSTITLFAPTGWSPPRSSPYDSTRRPWSQPELRLSHLQIRLLNRKNQIAAANTMPPRVELGKPSLKFLERDSREVEMSRETILGGKGVITGRELVGSREGFLRHY